MRTIGTSSIIAMLCLCLSTQLSAQVPGVINYQGRVTVGGTNFDGTGQFQFALVDGTGTTTYWSNDGSGSGGGEPMAYVPLTVTKGLYAVLLGDTTMTNMTAVPAAVFTNADVRLRVWFNDGISGFQQLTPDQRIASVGYALVAASVPDGSITSNKIAAGAVGPFALAVGLMTASDLSNNFITVSQASAASNLAASAISLATTALQPSCTNTLASTSFVNSAMAGATSNADMQMVYVAAGPAGTATNIVNGSFQYPFTDLVSAISAAQSLSPSATAPVCVKVLAGTLVEGPVTLNNEYIDIVGEAGATLALVGTVTRAAGNFVIKGITFTATNGFSGPLYSENDHYTNSVVSGCNFVGPVCVGNLYNRLENFSMVGATGIANAVAAQIDVGEIVPTVLGANLLDDTIEWGCAMRDVNIHSDTYGVVGVRGSIGPGSRPNLLINCKIRFIEDIGGNTIGITGGGIRMMASWIGAYTPVKSTSEFALIGDYLESDDGPVVDGLGSDSEIEDCYLVTEGGGLNNINGAFIDCVFECGGSYLGDYESHMSGCWFWCGGGAPTPVNFPPVGNATAASLGITTATFQDTNLVVTTDDNGNAVFYSSMISNITGAIVQPWAGSQHGGTIWNVTRVVSNACYGYFEYPNFSDNSMDPVVGKLTNSVHFFM